MKSLIIAFTLLLSVATTSVFAAEKAVSPLVLKSFNNTFNTATQVAWTVTESFYKATFEINGQYVTAFYLSDGSMAAVTRNISRAQLPVTLQADLAKYPDMWLSDLFELTTENNTQYYITLENGTDKVVLKSASNLSWTAYQKEKK
ncbi:MAG: hypothetical protein ABIN57_11485 [Chitinophagaceae bacterium]